MMKAVSAIIPAFNEAGGIRQVLETVSSVLEETGIEFEIIVVDDGSTDETVAIARRAGVRLIEHEYNRGYGAALKAGIRAAQHSYVLILDADGTYPPQAIPPLLTAGEEYEMVIGARTGENVAIPPHRRLPKWLLKLMAEYLTGVKIPDLNSGLRLFKKKSAEKYFNILPDGFSFTTTITVAFLSNNRSIKYIPINYFKRKGKSKFRPLHDTANLINLILRTSLYFNPLKVFVPFSFFLFLLAVLVFIYSKLFTPQVMDITIIVIIMAAVQILALGLIADLVDKRTSR